MLNNFKKLSKVLSCPRRIHENYAIFRDGDGSTEVEQVGYNLNFQRLVAQIIGKTKKINVRKKINVHSRNQKTKK